MQRVQLNLVPSGVAPVIYASRYDVGREFMLDLFDGTSPYVIPAGATVILQGTKPDGKSFAYSTEDGDSGVTFAESTVTVITTQQMTAVVGRSKCEIIVEAGNGVILGSLNFKIEIEEAAMPDDADTSATDLQAYEKMIARIIGDKEAVATDKSAVEKIQSEVNAQELKMEGLIDKWTKEYSDYKHITGTVVNVASSAWNNLQATVSVPGVTADSIVFLGAEDANVKELGAVGLTMFSQSINALTLKCIKKPEVTLTLNIVNIVGVA